MSKSVVIVGGGISGLSAAYFLQEGAHASGSEVECTLIERDLRLGGKVLTEKVEGLVIEGGPDSFLTLKPQALDLCKKLGLSGVLMGTNETRPRVFVYCEGKLRALPEGLTSVVPTRLGPFLFTDFLSARGKVRMLADLFRRRRRDDGDETLANFVKRRLGREALERLAEPLMAGIYAGDAEHLSMQANFPQLLKLEADHRSLVLGTLSWHKDEKSGRNPTFMTIRGGLRVLTDTLVSRLTGVSILVGRTLRTIRIDTACVGQRYILELDDGSSLRADVVILAAQAYESARILRDLNPYAASLLDSIPYASTVTVSLAYDRRTFSHPLDGSGFVVAPAAKRKITACTWVSSKWPEHSPPDRVLLRCFVGRFGDEEMLRLRDDELCKQVQAELQAILGIAEEPILRKVHRFDRSLPQYVLGHLEKLTALDGAMRATPGIFLTGSAYRGVGLPDCIKQAEHASELALGFRPQ